MIQIPSEVKIGGMTYRVEVVPDMIRDRGLFGVADHSNLVISLAEDSCEERRVNTFFHELVHAIVFEAGHHGDHDEKFINALSNTLHQVAVDNGWKITTT